VKQFAASFSDKIVILSQDDKAKVAVGIPAVRRHFETMQSVRESVSVANHDFLISLSQKLVPSVYLMINSKEGDDSVRDDQL